MTYCELNEGVLMPSKEALFDFVPRNTSGSTYSYSDEDGLTAGMNNTGHFVRFVFLLKSAAGHVAELPHSWGNYAFYLDECPVERAPVPLHCQLVFTSSADEPSFEAWAATVMRYLCACCTPSIPAFDCHDIASVLLGLQSPQLSFNLVRFDDDQWECSLERLPKSTHLLAVVFSPPGWFASVEDMDRLNAALVVHKEGMVKGGGAFHPYEKRKLMLLGGSN